MIARDLKDFEIVTALVAGQLAGGMLAAEDGYNANEVVSLAEGIVGEVVRRNDARTD